MSKVVIKVSTMDPDMQEFAIECASESILSKNTEQVQRVGKLVLLILGHARDNWMGSFNAMWKSLFY
jgi:hypothetical protein